MLEAKKYKRLYRLVKAAKSLYLLCQSRTMHVVLCETNVHNTLCRRSRGFGFIEYRDPRDADDAMYRMDGSNIGGRDITVSRVSGQNLQAVYILLIVSVMPY